MTAQFNIVILGGTGFVGRHLSQRLQSLGYLVNGYGREVFLSESALRTAVDGCDLLIMLAGANIGKRWTKAYKKALWDSRIGTNIQLAEVLKRCQTPPKRIVSASAVGIYPQASCDAPVDESCHEHDPGFLGRLGAAWEAASLALQPQPVIFRFGVVLGRGGALSKMLPAFKLGLGGPVAGGEQCFSWVHIDDLVEAFLFVIKHPDMLGVYNVTSPVPVTNAEFGRALAETLNRPFWLPLPGWQLKLMFGEGAQVLMHSSAVVPSRLQEAGFEFTYSDVRFALQNLIGPSE
ncbi:TIGR01777 family oxidoreductase [Thiomicrorhabdus sp. zzn3]|uniref:TIGR01777 family oxidoreductase n=1 Tax=Thiomicrorhabdus sp. zzn3 TaxID=3039775 RepID=UPI002436DB2F|nr:TIGR01777 family oxidoreductase [Thiomicrorhabdus sp. zzn3]MDG6777164.1 TIGR01777 family oxidoreductase [Thiomicrorhabdus sp. zzn3]